MALGLAIAACGYTPVSALREGDLPTLAVPLFENRTFEPLLEARLTERVKSRLIASGPWRVVNRPGTASLVVQGVVTGFGITPVAFDDANRALEQRLSITAQVTTRRRDSSDSIVSTDTATATAEYLETGEALTTRAAKNRAIEEAGDLLAQDLVARLVGRLAPIASTRSE